MSGRGTENGGVFFDVNHVMQGELKDKAPITFQTFLKNGVNLRTDRIEIAPLVQSFNGGVKIDENAATTVPGLFAVGEVSGGVHGADRPGGNNLADCQVFGYRGGRAAAALAADRTLKPNDVFRGDKLIGIKKGDKIEPIRKAIDRALMVVRQKESLEELLYKIQAFRNKASTYDVVTDNMLLAAEMIARSALLRKESRGVHYREDFPDSDSAFAKSSLINKGKEEEMQVFLSNNAY